jgi:polysaccharide export outer membrane protein
MALALCAVVLLTGACSWNPFASPAESQLSPRTRVVGEVDDYVIGVPDLLQLTVWQHPDFTGPLLTPVALAETIRVALSEFISNPRVDIAVTEMRSQVASVLGEGVLRSGIIQLQGNTRVIDAIAEMGGFSPFAKKDEIRILRDTPRGQVEYRFDYTAFIKGRNPASNILLEPGDTVIVPE